MNDDMKLLWYAAYKLAPDAIRPCVCSDSIPKSAKSVITSPYKIPTVIDEATGCYKGIKGWQNPCDLVGDHLEYYANNNNYGILLLCRDFVIIDIDIEDAAVVDKIHDLLPPTCYRYRDNSARRAYLYRKNFPLKKNIINSPVGAVEFLGDSQVAQIAGRHKSGPFVRWSPEFPSLDNIPALTMADFSKLYNKISMVLTGNQRSPSMRSPWAPKAYTMQYKDPESLAVLKSSAFIDVAEDGKIYVRCPRESEHTSPTNKADACYFPKGYNNSDRSGFHCFHTSHGVITVDAFLKSINYPPVIKTNYDESEAILTKQVDGIKNDKNLSEMDKKEQILALLEPELELRYNKVRKRSEILKTLDNYNLLFKYFPPDLYYDNFCNRVYYKGRPGYDGYDIELELDYSALFNFASTSVRTGIKSAIKYYLKQNQRDSLREYLSSLQWDGVRRIRDFHINCLALPRDDSAARSYIYYLFTALAARALSPAPVQADMILTLCGPQGIGKTSFVRALNPEESWYRSLNVFSTKEEKTRTAQGFFVIELAEISQLNDRIENEIKDFVTQTQDTWRPLYSDVSITKNRRFLLVGTSNHVDFLNDSTGNRRWLPLHIKNNINVDYLLANRDQLYAEAIEIYNKTGVLYKAAAEQAKKNEYKYLIKDRWQYHVHQYLIEINHPDSAPVNIEDLLTDAVGVRASDSDSYRHVNRMARVLRSMGYEQIDDNPYLFIKKHKVYINAPRMAKKAIKLLIS